MGIAFFDTGANPAFNQMPFIFMALQMSIMSGMQQMPRLINARDIMKLDVADRLYSEWAFIVSEFVVINVLSQMSNLLFLLIAFSSAGHGLRTGHLRVAHIRGSPTHTPDVDVHSERSGIRQVRQFLPLAAARHTDD